MHFLKKCIYKNNFLNDVVLTCVCCLLHTVCAAPSAFLLVDLFKISLLAGASQVEWFFKKAKVALAVAIIKSKPQGMSGREYAEALGCKLRSQDESWKEKAQGLQQEVLRLRQEMLITRVTSNMKSSSDTTGRPFSMCVVIKNKIVHLEGNNSNTLVCAIAHSYPQQVKLLCLKKTFVCQMFQP